MATPNVNAPFGFAEFGRLPGVGENFGNATRKIANANTNAIYRGDVVKSLSTGYIDLATPGTAQIAGIFIGCKYLSTAAKSTIWSPYWPGSGATGDIECYVCVDPAQLFLVQVKTGPVTMSAIDNNANFATGTGSTLNGVSGMTLDDGTITTTATLPFRIYDLYNGAPGSVGSDVTSAYNWVVVAFNNQDFKSLTGI